MRIAALALCLIALLLAASACGSLRFNTQHGGSAGVTPAAGSASVPLASSGDINNQLSGGGGPPPSLSDLQAFLNAELERLGKLPVAATSVAGVCIDDPVAATSVADYAPSARRLKPPPLEVTAVGAGLAPPSLPIVTEGGMNAAPTRTAAAAQQGQDNAVFDLSASAVDTNGAPLTPEDISGGAVVSAIKLTWTEQLSGDYDQNGEVNVGDLTPLAQHWEKTVAYDSPTLHGGFARWPSGNPEDPPVAASYSSPPLDRDPVAATSVADSSQSARRLKPPPLEVTAVGADCVRPSADARSASLQVSAASANNWRLARVDGDGNGEVNLADVTPIAVHWQEHSDGYRLYRKAPGESAYTALPYAGSGGSPSFDISLLRSDAYPEGASQADPQRPVRFTLSDSDARADKLGIGVYSYYVAAYDAQTDSEGPRSPVVSLDLATGSFNLAPVAKLSLSPDFAGAPAQITLNAAASYDLDGSIAELQWDLDADGEVDYSTSDPAPPEKSSGGLIDTITPGVPSGSSPSLVLTARYTQGSAVYMYPKVRAVDDKGAISAWQSAKLGISGWMQTVLNESLENYKMDVVPEKISADPQTGRFVILSSYTNPAITGSMEHGLYFLTQTDSGPWLKESIELPFLTSSNFEVIMPGGIVWNESGEPMVLFEYKGQSSLGKNQCWTALRRPNGTWLLEEHNVSSLPGTTSHNDFTIPLSYTTGEFTSLMFERLYDKDSLYGGGFHLKYHVLFYDHGDWRIVYAGYDTAESYDQIDRILGTNEGDLVAYFRVIGGRTGGPWAARWTPGVGFTDPYRIDGGSLHFGAPDTDCIDAVTGADGSRITLWGDYSNNADRQFWLLREGPGGEFKADNITTIGEHGAYKALYTYWLYATPSGAYGSFLVLSPGSGLGETEHIRIESDGILIEAPLPDYLGAGSGTPIACCTGTRGDVAALFRVYPTGSVSDFDDTYFLMERLDPRVAE